MKKAKNKKIVDFWNKIKKPLMILSIVGNILFLIFILVGCLGVKSKTQQVSATNEVGITSLRGTTWEFNETIDVKSLCTYEDNNFYYGDYYLMYRIDSEPFLTNGFALFKLKAQSAKEGNILYPFNALYIFDYDEGSTHNYVYYGNGSLVNSWNYDRVIHIGYEEYLLGQGAVTHFDYENPFLINWFYNNATLISNNQKSFTFLNDFNYNAPFVTSYDSQFCIKSDGAYVEKSYNVGFISNGKVFTNIVVAYMPGNGTAYLDKVSNTIKVNSNANTVYYSHMIYKNIETSESVIVNNRNFVVSDRSYIAQGSMWVNQEYRNLLVYGSGSSIFDDLAQFNSSTSLSNGISSVDSNVGLGNVFTLLRDTFSSFLPIFGISILPGLSLGLFIFLPLVVTIIIVIIKLVKR